MPDDPVTEEDINELPPSQSDLIMAGLAHVRGISATNQRIRQDNTKQETPVKKIKKNKKVNKL